jgi:hypothetical protein
LRALAQKRGVPVDAVNRAGDLKPKKADTLNSELTAVSAYPGLDQKNVTAWLDIRNKAAHGKYDEYTRDQVALMIQGIRDFLTGHPAYNLNVREERGWIKQSWQSKSPRVGSWTC